MERYGILFGPKAQQEAVRQIQTGTATHVPRVPTKYQHVKSYSVWRIAILGQTMQVVYDKRRKTIVTVHPREEEHHDPAFGGPLK